MRGNTIFAPRTSTPRAAAASRQDFTASRMLSVPPDVMLPVALGGAVEQVDRHPDDVALHAPQARKRRGA